MAYKSIIISCEHAGNVVPEKHQSLFTGAQEVLNSHRGWDPGALEVASYLADQFRVPLSAMNVTRLLIEMNRSLDSATIFSEFTENLSAEDRSALISEYYLPYHKALDTTIQQSRKPVLHLSVHSFTTVLNEITRLVDVGILFDPACIQERKFCEHVKKILDHRLPDITTLFNEPYKGTDDGIATIMRKKFPGNDYLGIEIELNQKFVDTPTLGSIGEALYQAIRSV